MAAPAGRAVMCAGRRSFARDVCGDSHINGVHKLVDLSLCFVELYKCGGFGYLAVKLVYSLLYYVYESGIALGLGYLSLKRLLLYLILYKLFL